MSHWAAIALLWSAASCSGRCLLSPGWLTLPPLASSRSRSAAVPVRAARFTPPELLWQPAAIDVVTIKAIIQSERIGESSFPRRSRSLPSGGLGGDILGEDAELAAMRNGLEPGGRE